MLVAKSNMWDTRRKTKFEYAAFNGASRFSRLAFVFEIFEVLNYMLKESKIHYFPNIGQFAGFKSIKIGRRKKK